MRSLPRRQFIAAAGLAALAGCTGESDPDSSTPSATPTSDTPSGAAEAAGDESAEQSLELPVVDESLPLPMPGRELQDEARSGGPPKDGIPSIDEPNFLDAGDADFLDRGDPVFGVVRNGVAKAYPQKVLVWHEIVNDTLDGDPVSVSYCPLTGTVLGFERGNTTFGVSGRLINNNLVMYDRVSETWWPQVLATAIPGPWHESPERRSLREFRLIWTTWGQWQDQHPETTVLSTDTGFAKNYDRDPYGNYNPKSGYYGGGNPTFPALPSEDHFDDKTVVMGARTPDGAAAFRKDALRDKGRLSGQIGDTPVLAVYDERYDTAYVYRNPDESTFELEDGAVRTADGRVAPDEVPLSRIHTFDAMWFAWGGFYPDTNVYE
jgi:hypothetical protein